MRFKRAYIQFVFFLVQNPFLQNFTSGRVYASPVRAVCIPSLNCYSCPAAPFSCPLGTIQYMFDYARMIPYYTIGILTAVGAFFGSATCGYFCPFGMIQDFLYKISPFKSSCKLPRKIRYLKWIMLIFFIIVIPLIMHIPSFCAWICPAGTLEAGIPILLANESLRHSAGITFVWKLTLLFLVILYVMREQRAFCRYVCPLGLMLGFFNKISLFQINVDSQKCKDCNICSKNCPMGLDLPDEINSIECIKCGECIAPCPFNALERKVKFVDMSKQESVISKK